MKVIRKAIDWEKIFANHIFDEELVPEHITSS